MTNEASIERWLDSLPDIFEQEPTGSKHRHPNLSDPQCNNMSGPRTRGRPKKSSTRTDISTGESGQTTRARGRDQMSKTLGSTTEQSSLSENKPWLSPPEKFSPVYKTQQRFSSLSLSGPPSPSPSSVFSAGRATHTSSKQSVSTKRSGSPLKLAQDLRTLHKPVEYYRIEEPDIELSSDVKALSKKINISNCRLRYLPHSLKSVIEAPDEAFNESDDDNAISDYKKIYDITQKSYQCSDLKKSEPSWNCEVHSPMLQLAVKKHKYVEQENISATRIYKSFHPRSGAKDDQSTSKMVDFALVLRLPSKKCPLRERIAELLPSQVEMSINPVAYSPLKYSPAGVIVETKTMQSQDDGRVQLGIWISAWHNMMKQLRHDDGRGYLLALDEKIISIPMILVTGVHWKLFYACDQNDSIHCIGPVDIGSTESVKDCYLLLVNLRTIADWVQKEFYKWIEQKVMGTVLSDLGRSSPLQESEGT